MNTRRTYTTIFVTAILMSTGGCFSDGGMNPEPEGSTDGNQQPDVTQQQFTVDQSGGTIVYRSTVHDVTVTLVIPAGALTGSTVITIEHARNFPPADGLVAEAVFDFGPDGLVFNVPADLDITYGSGLTGNLAEDDLRIHKASGANWVPLAGSADSVNNTVSAMLDSFSIYGLKTIPAAGTGASGNPNATVAWLQSNVFGGVCSQCHTGAGAPMGVDWSSEAATCSNIGRASGEISTMVEIESGNPAASYVIWKVEGAGPNGEAIAGDRMPLSNPPLTTETIRNMSDWIADGTPGCQGQGGGGAGGGAGGGGAGGGAGGGGTGGGGTGGGTDPTQIIPTWYGVQANILARFCTVCHSGTNPPMGLSWEVDQYATIVTNRRMSTENQALAIVEPGDPGTSYMFWKINGHGPNGEAIAGVRMPATGIPLEQGLIDVVEQWILDGAPLGVPDDASSGGSNEPAFPVGSWMYVWTESLQICTLCHSLTPSSPSCGVDFTCPPKGVVLSADNYLGVVDGDIVKPFDLDSSELWDRVTDDDPDKRMPFGLDPLTSRQLTIIRDWIMDGAPFCPTNAVCP